MKIIIYFLVFMINIISSATAKIPHEYFEESKNSLCSSLTEKNSITIIKECGSLMLKDSEKKLKQRTTEITIELKKWKQHKMIKLFKLEQKSWEKYKNARCYYASLGIKKENDVYQNNLDICHAIENYRRIETLEQEPYLS